MSFAGPSQIAVLAVLRDTPVSTYEGSQTSLLGALAVGDDRIIARRSMTALLGLLAVAKGKTLTGSATSMLGALGVYGENVREDFTQRAWGFELDGHVFYVLHLGHVGTYVYDDTTGMWSRWYTQGFDTWNMEQGWTWYDNRTVAGDVQLPTVWELNPDSQLDDEFRTIYRLCTGIIALRGYEQTLDVGTLTITASPGAPTSLEPTLRVRWSDDQGVTWSDYYSLTLGVGDYDQRLDFRSLGTIKAPGRVFEVSDDGGLVRISDAFIHTDEKDG